MNEFENGHTGQYQTDNYQSKKSADLENLRNYSKTKLLIADELRIILDTFRELKREKPVQQLKELTVKLAEDRFVLAVLGQFKRGKSLLMNAIIGKEVLPTGVIPVTSAITILKYGSKDKLVVNRIGSTFPEEYPVSSLSRFVTEKENPENKERIQNVCLEMQVPFLRRGIEFVDTPGIGSSNLLNTETTFGFLPSCDAALFVTSVDTPLSDTELNFLRVIRQYVNKVFFIINKTDLITASELDELLGYYKKTIQKETGNDSLRIFPVSGLQALHSVMNGDKSLLEISGLESLKRELISFLTGERFSSFLTIISKKILQILNDELDEQIPQNPELTEDIYRSALVRLQNARSFFESFPDNSKPDTDTEETVSAELMHRHLSEPKLIDNHQIMSEKAKESFDMKVPQCVVCHHLEKYLFDFFSEWQYKIGIDENTRETFAKELGFCSLHTWQLISLSSPRGASIGYARLAEEVSHRIEFITKNWPDIHAMNTFTHDMHSCRVCRNLARVENDYLRELSVFVQTGNGLKEYGDSHGLCLKHLCLLLPVIKSMDIQKQMLSQLSENFYTDAEDMRSFILKTDALRRYLQNKEEDNAWLRVVGRLVGNRSLTISWSDDILI